MGGRIGVSRGLWGLWGVRGGGEGFMGVFMGVFEGSKATGGKSA